MATNKSLMPTLRRELYEEGLRFCGAQFKRSCKRQIPHTAKNNLAAFMSNSFSVLKQCFIGLCLASVIVSPAYCKPPVVHDEIGKTLNTARKKAKMGIFVLGTTTCSHCRTLRKQIDGGEVSITADSFVMADLDSNDSKNITEFFKQFNLNGRVEWKIPYVVITNPKGKVLLTWNGGRKAPAVEKLVQEAKSKAGSKS